MLNQTLLLTGAADRWIPTGLTVCAGDTLEVRASGTIRFATWVPLSDGYPRDADGQDKTGQTERATPSHPAPTRSRNSLVFRAGGTDYQGGSQGDIPITSDGPLEMSNNDDFVADNDGSFSLRLSVNPKSGALVHRILFAVQGAAPASLATAVTSFADMVSRFTGGRVKILSTVAPLSTVPRAGEYMPNPDDYNCPAWSPYLEMDLTKAGHPQVMRNFDIVMRVFPVDPSRPAPTAVGLTWPSSRCTAIPVFGGVLHPKLDELLVHEYLHHLDWQFLQLGIPEFVNPDCYTRTSDNADMCPISYGTDPDFGGPDFVHFYENVLRLIDTQPTRLPVPYHRLDGRLGVWER